MSLLALSGTNSVSGGYEIDNSCKFEDDNDEYLYRTNASGTNRKTWTVSWWFKQTEVPSTRSSYVEHWQGGVYGEATRAGIDTSDRLWIDVGGGDGNTGTLFRSLSTARLRDTAAWYHVVIACDSTQSTEADRLKVWLNGVEVTAWDQHQIPTLNFQSALQGTGGVVMKWGSYDSTYNGYSGYLAECNYVDGVTATQNDFGEFDDDSGIWKPKEYTGSYGTNGSYLDFEIASDLGGNAKGNDVNFSLSNITAADQATDTPTNNFATLNPLSPSVPTYNTLTEGGTQMNSLGNAWTTVWSSVPLFKGKWYAEFKRTATNNVFIGAGGIDSNLYYFNLNYVGNNGNGTTFSVGLYSSNGDFYSGSGTTGSSYATNDILCLAVDQDNGAIYFRKNNDAWMGDGSNAGNPASGASRTGAQIIDWGTATVLAASIYSSGDTVQANFGGYTSFSNSTSYSDELGMGSFVYEPPASYLAICTKNLAEYG